MMKTTLFLLVFLISTSQIQLQQAYAGTVLTSISRTLKIINLDDLTDLERRRYLLNQKVISQEELRRILEQANSVLRGALVVSSSQTIDNL